MRGLFLLMGVLALCGCSGMRFVVEAVPAEDKLTETVVIEGRPGRPPAKSSAAKVALIDVTGMIADAKQSKLLAEGENPVDRFTESLRKAASDGKVKATVVRINSPGGTVTSTDVMYREVLHFKEITRKPVVMLMADVAASGGYYLACAGDEIIAHPTTVTGSIGVIIQTFNFSEGMQRIGIRADSITSGTNKSMGSPFEPMPPEHRELLQGLVDEFYLGFRGVVVENRPALKEEDIAWVTDGRVVTGVRAAEIGLVDRTGDLYDAFEAALDRAGAPNGRLVKYHRPMQHVGSAYATTPVAGGSEINLVQVRVGEWGMQDRVGFYYLWDPTVW